MSPGIEFDMGVTRKPTLLSQALSLGIGPEREFGREVCSRTKRSYGRKVLDLCASLDGVHNYTRQAGSFLSHRVKERTAE